MLTLMACGCLWSVCLCCAFVYFVAVVERGMGEQSGGLGPHGSACSVARTRACTSRSVYVYTCICTHMHRYAVLFMTLCKEDELPCGAVHLVAMLAQIWDNPWGISWLTLH